VSEEAAVRSPGHLPVTRVSSVIWHRDFSWPDSCQQPAVFLFVVLVLFASSLVTPHAVAQEAGGGDQIVTVQASSAASAVTLGGAVVAYKQVTLTAQIPGRIDMIAGTEGDKFRKDDILVAIDDSQLLAKRREVQSQIAAAQSQIANARVQYDREIWSPQDRSISRSGGMGMPGMFDQMFTQPFAQSFMPGNYGGNRWVDERANLYARGTQLSQAQAQLAAAQSQLEQIDAKLRDTRSFAPFDGVIIKKMVEKGDTVQPGQPLVEYADLTYLQVEVNVPVRLMGSLSKGMLVPVRLDVGDVRVDARVAQIFPTADPVRHTVVVKFDLPVGVPGGPGMYAEVMVPEESSNTQNVPVIPDSAVLWRGSLPAVYVETTDNGKELRLIRLGDYISGNQVAVLSGLKVGERIYVVPPAGSSPDWSQRSQ
jgi:multidrug efflux pump subunit AcrA (membrane-fusion protein)